MSRKISLFILLTAVICLAIAMPAYATASEMTEYQAADSASVEEAADPISVKAISAAATIGAAAVVCAIAMGLVIMKSAESIARQPEVEGNIRAAMMLGLVFIETTIIYALVVAILIIFVL